MDRHEVAALFETPPQSVDTAAPATEVAEAFIAKIGALPHAEGLVRDLRGRRHAVIERGSIDERLDGRTGLSKRLGRAIKAAKSAIEAALHGENASGLWGFCQKCARYFGHAADRITATGFDRSNNIADGQRRRPTRQGKLLAIGKANSPGGSHHAHTPVFVIDRNVR